jgi:hypothetical protein
MISFLLGGYAKIILLLASLILLLLPFHRFSPFLISSLFFHIPPFLSAFHISHIHEKKGGGGDNFRTVHPRFIWDEDCVTGYSQWGNAAAGRGAEPNYYRTHTYTQASAKLTVFHLEGNCRIFFNTMFLNFPLAHEFLLFVSSFSTPFPSFFYSVSAFLLGILRLITGIS